MSAPQTPENDRRILAAAPQDSNDWDDETWGAWWRAAGRVHGDGPKTAPQQPGREQEIRARSSAATPGPWGVYESGSMIDIAASLEETGCGYRARREIARLEDEPMDNDRSHEEWTEEEDWAQVQADAAFIANAPADVDWLLAENARLRTRVAELERPAIEAKRNEVRSSFTELIAQAEQDRDFEGAFDVQCRLREREDQWRREDETAEGRDRADRDAAAAAAVRRELEDAAKRQREFVLSDDFVCDDWEAALTVVDLIDPAVASTAGEQGETRPDMLPAWLYQRFGKYPVGVDWDELPETDQEYWAHEAAAAQRAVVRGGFKDPARAQGEEAAR